MKCYVLVHFSLINLDDITFYTCRVNIKVPMCVYLLFIFATVN